MNYYCKMVKSSDNSLATSVVVSPGASINQSVIFIVDQVAAATSRTTKTQYTLLVFIALVHGPVKNVDHEHRL